MKDIKIWEEKVCVRDENNWNVHFIKDTKAVSRNEIKPREIPIIKDKKRWVMNNDFPSKVSWCFNKYWRLTL